MDIQSVVKIARDAGTKILEVYARDDFGTRVKSDDSPLTEALRDILSWLDEKVLHPIQLV